MWTIQIIPYKVQFVQACPVTECQVKPICECHWVGCSLYHSQAWSLTLMQGPLKGRKTLPKQTNLTFILHMLLLSHPCWCFLTGLQLDLVNSIGQTADFGFEGNVVWGDHLHQNSYNRCVETKTYIDGTFGPYVQEVWQSSWPSSSPPPSSSNTIQ